MQRNFGLIGKRADWERKRTFNPEAAEPPWGDFVNDPRAVPFSAPSSLPPDSWLPPLIISLLILAVIFVVFTYFVTAALAREGDLLTLDCQELLKDGFFKPYDCLRVFMADDPLDAAEELKCAEKWRNGWHDGISYWTSEELVINCGEPPGHQPRPGHEPRNLLHRSRDDGRYANEPLHAWFNQLASGKGLCCSFADGFSVTDVDWDTRDGRYRVRLCPGLAKTCDRFAKEWVVVPDNAIVQEANRFGPSVVWPYLSAEGATQIRCFLRGTES
jgi:hypothetical protein